MMLARKVTTVMVVVMVMVMRMVMVKGGEGVCLSVPATTHMADDRGCASGCMWMHVTV